MCTPDRESMSRAVEIAEQIADEIKLILVLTYQRRVSRVQVKKATSGTVAEKTRRRKHLLAWRVIRQPQGETYERGQETWPRGRRTGTNVAETAGISMFPILPNKW